MPPEIRRLENLTALSLHENQLAALPENLRRSSNLKASFLHGNFKLQLQAAVLGFSWDEWSLCSGGVEHSAPKPGPILDYYFRTRAKAEWWPLCEGKLILVGRGDVGNTSHVRQLIGNSFSYCRS